MDFTGVSAFPLTPIKQGKINFRELTQLIRRIDATEVSSIGVLGSTGSYMYLSTAQRTNVLRNAVDATDKPVIAGIGDLTLEKVLKHTASAQKAGASALMLAPVGYQPLTPDEVYGLFYQVNRASDLPIIVYDNPRTTGFTFSDGLYRSLTELDHVASIKVPPPAKAQVSVRSAQLVKDFPQTPIGISGDHVAFEALKAGVGLWYSVMAGLFPELALTLYQLAREQESERTENLHKLTQPLFGTFTQYGSYRTIDALAVISGAMRDSSLIPPLKSIPIQTQKVLRDWYEIYRGYAKKGLLD